MASSILFLGTQMTVGGAQRVLLNQAGWFYQHGYDVNAVFLYDKDNLEEDWDLSYPFPVISLDAWQSGGNPAVNCFRLIAGILRLWWLLRKQKINIIETFTPDSNILGLFISRLAGVPLRIASHHGYIEGAGEWRKKLHGWLINSDYCDNLVAVSEQVKEMTINEEGVKPDKVTVIKNGIEPVVIPDPDKKNMIKEELGIKPDDFIFLTVGRLTLQKGHTYLLDAIPIILDRCLNDCVFLFAGEGHQQDVLREKSIVLGLEKHVRFLGVRNDIPNLLSIADVFVLPSLWEGLPLALLEAMSVGLPVVASRVEGVETVIKDRENGYLVPPKDALELAEALIEIRENPKTRTRFGKRNASIVKSDFTIDAMCKRYENLFLSLSVEDTL